MLPQPFDGCKLVLNKGLSQFFQTSHTIQLGSNIQPAQYQFGATYVGSSQISDREVSQYDVRNLVASSVYCNLKHEAFEKSLFIASTLSN